MFVIGPTANQFPGIVIPPIAQIKPTWSDDWATAYELEVKHCTVGTASHALDNCVISRRYGLLKHPWEQGPSQKKPVDLDGYWLRVMANDQSGWQQIWIGRIFGNTSDPIGAELGPAGVQQWQAYGPLQILNRIDVSQSLWYVAPLTPEDAENDPEHILAWLPPMNDRDGRGTLVGNATKAGHGPKGTRLYGETQVWTHYDYCDYLLDRFADDDAGPEWTLGGQAWLLKDIKDVAAWKPVEKLGDMLRVLIPRELGLDYKLVPTNSGFELHVFSLLDETTTYGGHEIKANPSTVGFVTNKTKDCSHVNVIETDDHKYGRIRVVGKRIVVCFSLRGDQDTLIPKWAPALEQQYLAGTGKPGDPPEKHDAARHNETLRDVYRIFGAPDDWDFNADEAAPYFDAEGQIDQELVGGYQRIVRATLTWLPLRAGFDYSSGQAVDHNAPGFEAETVPPQVWFRIQDGIYLPAEHTNVRVSVLNHDWGVSLQSEPAHYIAGNAFTTANGAAASNTPGVYDYRYMAATLAYESDQRIALEVELPDAGPADGTLVIEDNTAELWYLAKGTVVNVDPKDATKLVTMKKGLILRDDTDRLKQTMAGVLTRYFHSRARAEISLKGLRPWNQLLGMILEAIDTGGVVQSVRGPITSITWTPGSQNSSPLTEIRAGFAT